MRLHAGFTFVYDCPAPTPMLLMVRVHPSRERDLITTQQIVFDRAVGARDSLDAFGNRCIRIVAPAGRTTVSGAFDIADSGAPDPVVLEAAQSDVALLPDAALPFLLASRYVESDALVVFAWAHFRHTPPGWARVQAICDFVHGHLQFDYARASPLRTAQGALAEGTGVCRDFAHLAIALCRAMNIPARYCTGYLGDIGVPPAPDPMDFSAWFEVWLGGTWHIFDARHNHPRIGRVLMARGRDATDVALSTSFGTATLVGFEVVTEEATERARPLGMAV